jgi:hypothetical protein
MAGQQPVEDGRKRPYVPAIPIIRPCAILIEIAGTSPAMTPRVLLLLHGGDVLKCSEARVKEAFLLEMLDVGPRVAERKRGRLS